MVICRRFDGGGTIIFPRCIKKRQILSIDGQDLSLSSIFIRNGFFVTLYREIVMAYGHNIAMIQRESLQQGNHHGGGTE